MSLKVSFLTLRNQSLKRFLASRLWELLPRPVRGLRRVPELGFYVSEPLSLLISNLILLEV